MSEELPRQLANLTLAPGVLKADYTDFVVDEIPLYPADGAGTHTYFLLEKAGLSTAQAVYDIARALNVPRHDIGFAGQKDARAVTRQWMSVEHIEPERLAALDLPRLRVVETTRHHNKLRLGHLKGNRFVIKIRQTATDRIAELQDGLAQLAARGVPNYFGEQRFGYRGDTWRIGAALVRNVKDEALDLILGKPTEADRGGPRRARQLYDQGRYKEALRQWPLGFRTERRAVKALVATEGNRRRAFQTIDRSTRTFFISAYQSHLFNQVVAARLPHGLDRLWAGDLAWLHVSGAVFHVTDPSVEQPRADALEISPTGPLFGYRMTHAEGEPGRLEDELLAREGLTSESFRAAALRTKGGRRPLRFPVHDAEVALGADARGPYLELRFVLPRGCYATAVLRELFDLRQPEVGETDEVTEASDD